MYKEIAKLVLYGHQNDGSILCEFEDIFREFDSGEYEKADLTRRILSQIKRILEVSTDYGFNKNLWQNYLTFLLITNENPFSLTCEKVGANDGSVNMFALNDCKAFMNLFNYDFSDIEHKLDINCFSIITNYTSIEKTERMYNKNVSEKVRTLCDKLEKAITEEDFFKEFTYEEFCGHLFRSRAFNEEGTFVALEGEEVVGFASSMVRPSDDGNEKASCYLHTFFVKKEYRKVDCPI